MLLQRTPNVSSQRAGANERTFSWNELSQASSPSCREKAELVEIRRLFADTEGLEVECKNREL